MRWIWIILVFATAMVVMAEEETNQSNSDWLNSSMLQDHSQMDTDCLSCHNDIIPTGNSHMIEGNDDCQFCHNLSMINQTNSEGSSVSGGLMFTETENYVCVACHVEQDKSEQMQNVHIDMGCISCHNPHGSPYGKMFIASENDFCGGECHGNWDIGITHPTGENIRDPYAGASLSCVSSCHSVHESASNSRMLQVSYSSLCSRCHPDKA